ncbi:UNVERIFIED_CONTAM: hypothetical protein RMT77_018075 [Armadillidium vulgare]
MGPKLDDFEIISTIGRGSHGTVRKVKRNCDGKILVWKELHYASMNIAEKQGLVLEVNVLRELNHPNIVRFYGHYVDRQAGMLYIFMEYCPGGDLHKIIQKCKKTDSFLEEGFIWRVLKQVCEALRTCHDKHTKGGEIILHRDIKPANIFLDKDGNIKVGDFGLARTLNSGGSLARTFVGTPYYMSPEVIDGRAYNEQSDMWSLGCLIYELCTLKPPFDASSQAQLCSKIKSGKFDRIPVHYSKELWCTIQELLTQEDFLRPTSFLLLYNQTLKKNTDLKKDESEVMFDSLMESINKEATKKDSSFSEEESNSFGSLGNTVKEREKSEEKKRLEESVMKEVETMLKESQLRKEEERNERLQYKELNIDLLQSLELENAKKSNDEECNSKSLQERIKKELSPPKCVCGGTTLEEWNKRVNLIRSNEAALRKKEMEIEARERELVKRERRVQAMEKEAKDHIQRAQIYLKQTRTKCFRPFQLKLTEKYDKFSDFDATTVSADLGYDDKPTVAYIDTQPANNPFLKMRESKLYPASKRETYLKRSNTLDNPKSRPKQGNYYILDQSERNSNVEKMKKDEHLRSREEDLKSKLNVLTSHVTKNEQKINKSDFFGDKQKGIEKDLKVKNCTVKQLSDNKNNTRNVFHSFRHNFTKYKATGKENIVGNPKKIDKSKPNIIGRKPLQALRS